jgi:hypothetical protein
MNLSGAIEVRKTDDAFDSQNGVLEVSAPIF